MEPLDHAAIRDCAYELAEENPSQAPEIIRGMRAAEHLNGQFYEVYITLRTIELALEDIVPLLEILWGFMPEEYTGGMPFIEYGAS